MKTSHLNAAEVGAILAELRAGTSIAGVARCWDRHPNTIRGILCRYGGPDSVRFEALMKLAAENLILRRAAARSALEDTALTHWFSHILESSRRIGAAKELELLGLSRRRVCALVGQPRRILDESPQRRTGAAMAIRTRASPGGRQRRLRKLLVSMNAGRRPNR